MECLGLHNKPKAEVHLGHKLTGPKEVVVVVCVTVAFRAAITSTAVCVHIFTQQQLNELTNIITVTTLRYQFLILHT
jgi:hypothetical protein